MILLIKLILAHLLGDFVLQPSSWVKKKEQKKLLSIQLYWHLLVHGALIMLLLWDKTYWLLAILLMLLHGTIDVLKVRIQKAQNKTKCFLIDQALHLVSIFLVWYFWTKPTIEPILAVINEKNTWIYLTAIVFITSVSGFIIQVLMAKWAENIGNTANQSLQNAGKYIGILERLFVFTFVVSGNWEAIGFLLAAKSIFRFGDLRESKDIKMTEYILIGTLLSFAIAVASGLLVLKLIA